MDVLKTLDCDHVEENDLVSRYLARKLSPEEAEAFEEHYFGCDRCWAEVQAATEVRAALSEDRAAQHQLPARTEPRVIRGPWSSWGLIAAAAALGALAVGTVLYLAGRVPPDSEKALAQALGNELPVEVRLSGRFSSLKPQTVLRGAGPPQNASGRLRAAAGRAFEAAEEESSPPRLHSAGLAHLFLGELDLAIRSLEEASQATRDAQFLSDLAAAYWIRGRQSGNQADFRRALQKAEDAIARNPRLPEAWFNRAMVLEKIVPTVPDKIRKAWADYLSLDTKSPWADLARDHLGRLGEMTPTPAAELWNRVRPFLEKVALTSEIGPIDQIVRRFPQQSRQYVEEELLPSWGEAIAQRSSSESNRVLGNASRIASALGRVTGNTLPSESILAIENAARTGRRLSDLAAGHRAYGEGQKAYRQRSTDRALSLFQKAATLLRHGQSPFVDAALLGLAGVHFNQNDYPGTVQVLDGIRIPDRHASAGHLALAARSRGLRGLTYFLLGSPSEALTSLQISLLLFERIGEVENVAAIETLLAETFDYLGQRQNAWTHRDRALRILNEYPASPSLALATGDAATASMDEGQVHAALFYFDYEIEFARLQLNEPLASDALHNRGLLYLALGQEALAGRDMREARNAADRIPDGDIRKRAIAELAVTEARLTRGALGEKGVVDLSEALSFFRKTRNHYGIARALLERAVLNRRAGRIDLAKSDLMDAAAELHDLRERLPQEEYRISYFANGQQVFEELISILVAEGKAREAFDVLEQARARALLDRLTPSAGDEASGAEKALRPLTAAQSEKRVPPGAAIVEYFVLEDRLLIWVVQRNGVTLHTIKVRSQALEESINRFCRALRGLPERSSDSRRETNPYSFLIEPVAKQLGDSGTIVMVPDKFLNSVPFAALRDPSDGRYLLEKYRLAIAPSATLFLQSLARDGEIANDASLAALVVGNPSLDGKRVELADLPSAEEEVERLAKLFGTSQTLQGRYATKARFIELAPSHDVIHFAGHSILNAAQPDYSSLVFTPTDNTFDSGLLYAHELRRVRFARTRLIFLAACDTAAGERADGEGVLSLARAFLGSGLPAAIGTLWPVEDAPATELASRFYEHLLAGEDAITALRSAQLQLLHSADPRLSRADVWAAFEIIGATTLRLTRTGGSDGQTSHDPVHRHM